MTDDTKDTVMQQKLFPLTLGRIHRARGDSLKSSARTYIKEYIKAHGMPDALLCRNDDIAIGAYRGLCDMGIKVPEQVCITGCDGTEHMKYLEVPITTIEILSTELSKRALELMLKRIKNPDES